MVEDDSDKEEFFFFKDAKDHFKVEDKGERHCILLLNEACDNARCNDEDCRHCMIASNPYLVGKFDEFITQETKEADPEASEEKFAEARAKKADEQETIVKQMLNELPAKKWTKDMVKAYCSKHGIERWFVDEIYGLIRMTISKETNE